MTTATLNKPTPPAAVPAPPADKPPLPASSPAPATPAAFIAGCIPSEPHLRGSVLRQSALVLAFDGPFVVDPRHSHSRAAAFRTEIDAESKRRIRAAVASLDDSAIGGLRDNIARMTKRLPQLEALADEWGARLRRLQTEDAAPEQIAEAQQGFVAASEQHEQIGKQLAQAREQLSGLEATRRRNAESAAAGILNETVTALQQRREKLFGAIAAKIAPELAELIETETRIHALGRDYVEWARDFSREALQAIEKAG